MPSQAEVRWSQLKVGTIVLVSLVLLSTLLFLMTSATGLGLFQKHLMVTAYFDNASGLNVGAPVQLEGVAIGEVRRIRISTDPARKQTPVKVLMKLSPKYEQSLHKDSVAALETSGVLGDTDVEINSRDATGPPLESGDELPTRDEPSIQDVIKSSQTVVASLDPILKKLNNIAGTINEGKGTAGKLVNDPVLYNRAVQTVNQLERLTQNLNAGKGSVGKLLNDDSLYNHLNDAATRLDAVATGLDSGRGTAGKLLTDETLYNNLNSTLKQTNSLLTQVNSGKGGLGMLIKDQAFANHLNDTVSKLDLLLTNVNSGKGTLGKLATDDAAYNNLNQLLTQSTNLVTMIRQDPKKYLTIHMRIF